MEERTAYGHEAKISLILMGRSSSRLTPEEEIRLKWEFDEWWEMLKRGSMESVSDFMNRWHQA